MFKPKDGPLKSSISNTMGTHSCKFDEKMKSLKEQFIESTDATGIKHSNNNLWFADNTIYYYYC